MNTWTPLWSQVVDSSLWEEKPSVRVLFVTMMALKDADHIVRYDAYKLHKKANLTPDDTKEALLVLSSPDTRRKDFTQEFDGRRIQEVDDGWLILNGEKYRTMIQKMKQREYKTQWQREKRLEEKETSNFPSLEEVKKECDMRGFDPVEAEKFWNHFESGGWCDKNGHEIKKWRPKLATWAANQRSDNGKTNGAHISPPIAKKRTASEQAALDRHQGEHI